MALRASNDAFDLPVSDFGDSEAEGHVDTLIIQAIQMLKTWRCFFKDSLKVTSIVVQCPLFLSENYFEKYLESLLFDASISSEIFGSNLLMINIALERALRI